MSCLCPDFSFLCLRIPRSIEISEHLQESLLHSLQKGYSFSGFCRWGTPGCGLLLLGNPGLLPWVAFAWKGYFELLWDHSDGCCGRAAHSPMGGEKPSKTLKTNNSWNKSCKTLQDRTRFAPQRTSTPSSPRPKFLRVCRSFSGPATRPSSKAWRRPE